MSLCCFRLSDLYESVAFLIYAVWLAAVSLLATALFRILKIWQRRGDLRNLKSIGIFHPYCNAGGGGERVLWGLVKYLELRHPDLEVVIYTGDHDVTSESILKKMHTNFKIELSRKPRFVFLKSRVAVEASIYPFFTLLFQSLGSVILGLEGLFKHIPDYYIDTMGYSFTYPIFKYLGGSKVACYVHYPVISTDMLDTVSSAATTFNNRAFISRSKVLTAAKKLYYQLFAALYGVAGRRSSRILVNSSWTKNHINELWQVPSRTHLVYPPCNTSAFEELPLDRSADNECTIVSVAQFRPEKNIPLQLETFKLLTDK